ncbi:MAG: DUF1467 family protein [Rhizobiales bacterium]|nr:DUF1467 family protein [Hyphomicrobiales bacterium]
MAYTISTAIAIYFVIWWIVLFVTLPFGVKSQSEQGGDLAGTDPGAPILPRLGRKMLWTTIISAVIYGVMSYLYGLGYLNIERISKTLGFPF